MKETLNKVLELQESLKVISLILNNEMNSEIQLKLMTDPVYYEKIAEVVSESLNEDRNFIVDYIFQPTENSTPANFKTFVFKLLPLLQSQSEIDLALEKLKTTGFEGVPLENMNHFTNLMEIMFYTSIAFEKEQFFESVSIIGHENLPNKTGQFILKNVIDSMNLNATKKENTLIQELISNPDSKALMLKALKEPENEYFHDDLKQAVKENSKVLGETITSLYSDAFNLKITPKTKKAKSSSVKPQSP